MRVAPFTDDEIESLQAYQYSDNHPFTCGGNRTDIHHSDGEGVLIPVRDGWRCPYCTYCQNWCHDWMADWTWKGK